MPSSFHSLIARLELWLAAHRPRFLRGLRPGIAAQALDRLEQQAGLCFPAELRELLSWHDGQGESFIGYFKETWLLMSGEAIVKARTEIDLASSLGWNSAWLPFLDNDAGDYLCLDLGAPGFPVVPYWLGNQGLAERVAESLAQWLGDFVDGLEKGDFEEDPERGSLTRKCD